MPDTIDRTTLPAAFLELAKAQARVTHAEDDALITEQLAQAIDDVERLTNATIFERQMTLTPPELGLDLLAWAVSGSGNWISLPFNNVSALEVLDGAGTDISAAYTIKQRDPGGTGTTWLQGPATAPTPAPATFTFTAGMKTTGGIAPALRRLILRRAAALYEFRESALPLTADDLAGEPGLWRPDV